MARKSRKHAENPTVPIRPLALRTAAYLRISEAKSGQPPESVENQLKIIEEFMDGRPDLTLAVTYSDINVSGRSFQREGFQQMIEAIECGEIDCVIVKDSCVIIDLNQKDPKMLGLSGLVYSFLTEKRTFKNYYSRAVRTPTAVWRQRG